jgi:3-hydroxyisobutyrate dehydrogenase-like beta-hydroxyacid dehydrogenase
MRDTNHDSPRIGWVGTGRMGFQLARRLLDAGYDLAVWNRTRAKAEPLAEAGAVLVDQPADLADRDIVFTMVSGSEDLKSVTLGADGLLSDAGRAPRILVDSSTVSADASAAVRERASDLGTALLAAPVSGNPKVVKAGLATLAVSGPRDAYEQAQPVLMALGRGVTHVGGEDEARLVKICHNLMLGVVTQCLAEITVLAEKGGIARADFLSFLNDSVMGSVFTRYKTPALVTLDFTPTFTPELLRKDCDLGLAAALDLDASLPLTSLTRSLVQDMIDAGKLDIDFAALLLSQAEAGHITLEPEPGPVPDGLEPVPATAGVVR